MKQIILFTIFLLTVTGAFSAYLKNVPVTLKQPDGTDIECFVTGDEFHRRIHDTNNYTIVQDSASGYYVYADLRNSQLVPTRYVVGQYDPQKLAIRPGYDILPSEMEAKRQTALKSAAAISQNPTTGNINNIVISIRFLDQELTQLKETDYEQQFNSQQGVSLKYFFNEVSNNQLNVSSYFFPQPKNDTVFEYLDMYPRAYYTPYNAVTNPIGYPPEFEYERNLREKSLLKRAIWSVGGQIEAADVDFDSNDDGIFDNVIFVLQGKTDGWGNILWPMAATLLYDYVLVGKTKVGSYNKQLSEWFSPSVFSHEFFHSLGAPDLYRYYDTKIDPVGAWDMMAASGTQHMTTFMKWKYGKWFDSVPEITGPGTYSLEPVSQNPYACYKIPSPRSSTEYFIVEYRKKEGLLEGSLPRFYDEGLIIYRINAIGIKGNAKGPPDEVYVYRPYGDENYSGQLYSAAFSADKLRTFFNSQSNPSCFLSSGEPGWIDISDVSAAGNEIRFTVNEVDLFSKPANFLAAEENGEILFTWQAPSDTTYTLQGYNIYRVGNSSAINPELINGTRFTIPIPGPESYYAFQLVAVYSEGESNPVIAFYTNPDFPFVKDSLALVVLFNRCNGPDWLDNSNWLDGPLDTWYGVTVENQRVTALNLQGKWYGKNFVTNYLPAQIGDLTALQNLDLSYNALEGNLPAQIGDLIALRSLDLSYNTLEGNLPDEIGRLKNLEELKLADNDFTGTIPDEFGELINLQKLSLSNNSLDGEIPDFLWNLNALKELNLQGNKFIGELSENIGSSINLETLDLGANLLQGAIPAAIGNLNRLEILALGSNHFSELDWDAISSLTSLRVLRLYNNELSGIVPPEIGRLKKLEYLNLSSNRFSGELPDIFEEFNQLTYLNLANNQFQGIFPPGIAHLTQLMEVIIPGNGFYAFPKLYSPVLWTLILSENRFTFEDIEIVRTINFYPKHPDFMYNNQAKIGKAETKYALPGKSYTLRVYCGGKLNCYQWFKDGTAISEVSDSPEFVVEEVVPGNNGEYFCQVTNESISSLTIESQPVTIVGKDTLTAHAGHDFGADELTLVTLNGTLSNHPGDGYYRWTGPAGIELTGADAAQPKFTAPEVDYDTEFIFTLVVNDGTQDSAPDEVAVTVRDGQNAPVADAGANQTVDEGEHVTLDGSGSFDPQGWALTYHWTGPAGIELMGADEAQPHFTAPEVDNTTEYVFTLVVNDRTEDSAPDSVTVTVKNLPEAPVADAGPDQAVDEGEWVTLDGSNSFSPGGEAITCHWTAPDGIDLIGAGEVQPQFIAPEVISDSVFTFILVVSNGAEESEPDEVAITVLNLPEPPVADAGPDQTVDEGVRVTLNGSNSFSPDGEAITCHWTAPDGIDLTGADDVQPYFTAPEVISDSVFIFILVVSNGTEESEPDEVYITVNNLPKAPVADAGLDQTVFAGELVVLNGSGSLDPEGKKLFYEWQAPEGIIPDGINASTCTFSAPEFYVDTTLVFYLVVINSNELSDTCSVQITVKTAITAARHPAESGPFYVYPNPSEGLVYVKLPHIEPGSGCSLLITNALGEKVLEKKYYYSGTVRLDLSGKAPGIYFFKLMYETQIDVVKMIIGTGKDNF